MKDLDSASAYALACDLIGEELGPLGAPAVGRARRASVERAARCVGRGEVVPARGRGRDVAVVKLEDGRVFALPDHCPHAGGPLSDGFVDAGRLVCARHGWELDVASGAWVGRPGLEVEVERVE